MPRPLLLLPLILLASCVAPDAPEAQAPSAAPGPAVQPPGGDQRPHAPPQFDRLKIPAENPAWENIREGFSGNPGFYGERRWDDVSARVFGHQSVALRDLARASAASGDLRGAAAIYRDLARRLTAIELSDQGIGAPLRAMLVAAAERDAALCEALAAGRPPPEVTGGPGVAALRSRYLGAAVSGDAQAMARVAAAAGALSDDPPWAALDHTKFDGFDDRHALRIDLYRHALDATDPLSLDYSWGYWTAEEATLQVQAIEEAALDPARATPGRPGEIAARIRAETRLGEFSAVSLGWLPTGDSYVDVAGEPGPLAIGTLEKLGLDDEAHRAWLEARAEALNAAMASDPDRVPELIAAMVEALDAHPHGSRFYNIKQAKNDGIRQLARAGHYAQALAVARTHYPLRDQDWACPNRMGIAQGIEGRLMVLADEGGAITRLEEAVATGDRWLADIAGARRAPGPGH